MGIHNPNDLNERSDSKKKTPVYNFGGMDEENMPSRSLDNFNRKEDIGYLNYNLFRKKGGKTDKEKLNDFALLFSKKQ